MGKSIINAILYCIFLSISFLAHVQADEYQGEVWMQSTFSLNEKNLNLAEKTAKSRYERFLNSHRIFDKDGLKKLTEQDFQNDNVAFLTIIDIYKPGYPKDSLE